MQTLTPEQLRMWIGILVFLSGLATFAVGVFVLVTRALSADVHRVATRTAKLAQKGMLEDASGLVGNANALLISLNKLVRTTAGTALFLIALGITMMVYSYQYILHLS